MNQNSPLSKQHQIDRQQAYKAAGSGTTLAQKLIARAAGHAHVNVGDVLTCQVDLAMFHDSSGPRRLKPMLAEIGAQIWDRNKVVLVLDHYVPATDADSEKIIRITRDVAKEWQLPHVIDSEGICHVVLPERGHLKPGFFCVGGDSHSPTGCIWYLHVWHWRHRNVGSGGHR